MSSCTARANAAYSAAADSATPAWRICCWRRTRTRSRAARAAGAPVFRWRCQSARYLAGCRLTHAHMVVLTFAHAQQALRIAQAIAERRPALTLWVSCRITTAGRCISRHAQRARDQQSSAAAIGLAEQVMSTLGMSTELDRDEHQRNAPPSRQQPYFQGVHRRGNQHALTGDFQVLHDVGHHEFLQAASRASPYSFCRR